MWRVSVYLYLAWVSVSHLSVCGLCEYVACVNVRYVSCVASISMKCVSVCGVCQCAECVMCGEC